MTKVVPESRKTVCFQLLCTWRYALQCFFPYYPNQNIKKIEIKTKYLLFDFLSSSFHTSFNFLGDWRLAVSAFAEWSYILGAASLTVPGNTCHRVVMGPKSSCSQDVQLACRNSRKPSACCDLRAAISIHHKPPDNRIVFTHDTYAH